MVSNRCALSPGSLECGKDWEFVCGGVGKKENERGGGGRDGPSAGITET